jgi:anti-sigma regulatory factor (Ser/Thr protein kinase)
MAAETLAGSDHLQSALVLVSELVTNAVLHTGGPAELRILVIEPDAVRVEVADHARDIPRSPPTAGAHGGFGLRIVAALADEWGCTPLPHGKVVWFELGRGPERTSGTYATHRGSRRVHERARDHRMGDAAHG